MQYEEMLSWLLYYVALFQVDKSPPAEIADPVGLVLSQAVRSPDGGFRVVLNGSAATQTLVARFLHAYAGAGVQSIAFATDDIFDTAAKLRRLGMEFLSIPPNYYDDLGARYGLDDAVLARMAEFNILYDEDAGGSYHHCIRAPSSSASSSRSSSAAPTTATGRAIPRSGSPRSPGSKTCRPPSPDRTILGPPRFGVLSRTDGMPALRVKRIRGWLAERRKPRPRLRGTSSQTTPSARRPTSWPWRPRSSRPMA